MFSKPQMHVSVFQMSDWNKTVSPHFMKTCQKKESAPVVYWWDKGTTFASTAFCALKGQRWKRRFQSIGFERIKATQGQDEQNLQDGDQVLSSILMFMPSVGTVRWRKLADSNLATLITGKMSYIWILLRHNSVVFSAAQKPQTFCFPFHVVPPVSSWEGELGPWQQSVFTLENEHIPPDPSALTLLWRLWRWSRSFSPEVLHSHWIPAKKSLCTMIRQRLLQSASTHFHSLRHSVTGGGLYWPHQTVPPEGSSANCPDTLEPNGCTTKQKPPSCIKPH